MDKLFWRSSMLDQKQLQRFQNEARAAASLRHPSIVQVHFVGCERAVHFYAMEFIEGETLAQVLPAMREAAEGTETPFGRKGTLAFYSNLADAFAANAASSAGRSSGLT